jgi:hypothetical protein
VAWEKNFVINGIHFEKFVYSSYRGDMIGYLAEDTLIQNYPCKKGFIVFHDDWSLEEFQFSKPFEFNGLLIPAKTWASLDKEGNITILMFPEDTWVQGHLCRGSKMGRQGVHTSFYKNKKLKSFFARENTDIDGILCKGSLFHPIRLHDNGKLMGCTLAKTMKLNGTDYKEKSKIKFDREGNVISSK